MRLYLHRFEKVNSTVMLNGVAKKKGSFILAVCARQPCLRGRVFATAKLVSAKVCLFVPFAHHVGVPPSMEKW
uniref:Uncharacterized protein n=1 Tax=Trichuris muris TaxID=70415 RepID=A0A5S6QTL6_TRIMR